MKDESGEAEDLKRTKYQEHHHLVLIGKYLYGSEVCLLHSSVLPHSFQQ